MRNILYYLDRKWHKSSPTAQFPYLSLSKTCSPIECRHAGFAPRPNILCENLGFRASILQGQLRVLAFAVQYLLLPCSICFCREVFASAVSFCFCREVFAFAVKYLLLAWVFAFAVKYLLLPWVFAFAVRYLLLPWVFGFAVRYLLLPWRIWFCREVFCFCREVFGFAVRYFVFAVRVLVLPWQLWATVNYAYAFSQSETEK